MGSFGGHILPGTFFLLFGIWWTYSMFSRYFKALAKKGLAKRDVEYECTSTYSPFEGYLKVIAASIGIVAEFVTAFEGGKFVYIGNSQHITMFLFFGINGLTDLLIHYGYPLPKGSDYMTMSLANGIETLLFWFHLHGRTPLDIHVHTLLIVGVMVSTIACLIEWKYRYNMLSSFFRTLCALLQGTWFYQVGFTLYPPFLGSEGVDEHSHREIMLITAIFCWHIAGIMLFMAIVGYCFYLNYRSVLLRADASNRQSIDSYSDIKYKTLEDDVSLEMVADKKKSINNNLNNVDQRKYSLDESTEEGL